MAYDILVIPGRFAPFHNGHLDLVLRALEQAGRVILLIEAAEQPRSCRVPWSATEREGMIRASVTAAVGDVGDRLIIRPVVEHLYDEGAWYSELRAQAAEIHGVKAAVVGKPMLHLPAAELTDTTKRGSGEVRAALFGNDTAFETVRAKVPPAVFEQLSLFRTSDLFPSLRDEYDYVTAYKASWKDAPYPPIFSTVDAVVQHGEHLLMIQRGRMPGMGQWALPGGFVERDEWLVEAALRELCEETGIDVPANRMYRALQTSHVFDAPHRASRGRIISHGFYFRFDAGTLPAIKGGDDAAQAAWMPLSEVWSMREQMFEDHFCILEYFLGSIDWS